MMLPEVMTESWTPDDYRRHIDALESYLNRAYHLNEVLAAHIRTLETRLHEAGRPVPRKPFGTRAVSDVQCGLDPGPYYLIGDEPIS